MEQKPSVGRIVHYQEPYTEPGDDGLRAAIIVRVESETVVTLRVLSPFVTADDTIEVAVSFSAKPETRCWSWPPRV